MTKTHMERNRERIAKVRAENLAPKQRKVRAARSPYAGWHIYMYSNVHRIRTSDHAPSLIQVAGRTKAGAARIIAELLRVNGASEKVCASVKVWKLGESE